MTTTTNTNKQATIYKLKTWGVIIAFCIAGWLFWQIVAEFMWICYRAGIPM